MRQLLAVDSPFPEANSVLRFLEPPDSCVASLWSRLFEGAYDKPFIIDSGLRRSLHFSFDGVQSCMDRLDPDRLTLAYTRRMMAFLLFNGAPSRILLLGLGGGSLAKFCYRRLPEAAVTAVEINADVTALREEFQIPADDARFRVVHGNAADYVARTTTRKDVILVDVYTRSGMAAEVDTVEFYESARRCLTPSGILVINVCSDLRRRQAHFLKIRRVFGEEFLTLPVRRDGNVITFAFKGGCDRYRDEELNARAPDLKRRFELNFPRYVRRIALDLQLRRWQQVLSSENAQREP